MKRGQPVKTPYFTPLKYGVKGEYTPVEYQINYYSFEYRLDFDDLIALTFRLFVVIWLRDVFNNSD